MEKAHAGRTARARARELVIEEILVSARTQLAEVGASGLSLRAIARDLGMVSSAIYRYFGSRDELLTALIIGSYDALGDVVDEAISAARRKTHRMQWVDAALAAQRWALDHPHEYALLYGSPVPGYAAPEITSGPGTRVARALMKIVAEAGAEGSLTPTLEVELSAIVRKDLERLRETAELEVSVPVLAAALIAWTQLFGLVSFEVFGQTRGIVEEHERFFQSATLTMAASIGL